MNGVGLVSMILAVSMEVWVMRLIVEMMLQGVFALRILLVISARSYQQVVYIGRGILREPPVAQFGERDGTRRYL